MKIVFVTTHLVMAICIVSILYFSLKAQDAIGDPEQKALTNRFYIRGLKLIAVIATTGYRIAVGVLVSNLK